MFPSASSDGLRNACQGGLFYLPTRKEGHIQATALCCAAPSWAQSFLPGSRLHPGSRVCRLQASHWTLGGGCSKEGGSQSGPVPSMAPICWQALQASRRGRCARVLASAERHVRSLASICRRFCQGATGVVELSTVVGVKVPTPPVVAGRHTRDRCWRRPPAPLLQRGPREGPEGQPGGSEPAADETESCR